MSQRVYFCRSIISARSRCSAAAALLFSTLFWVMAAGPASAICQLVANAPFKPPAPGEFRVWNAALQPDEIQIRYIGHSTFELETPKGIRIATDYNDSVRPFLPPTVATMNGAHSTHYSVNPDPGIEHILYGWNRDGGPMDHDLTVGDVRIRNVQTNIRGWDGETRRLGNSIFIFEVADLCIAHLGHLHHRLTKDDLTRLGQIDIVFAAIDNSTTLRLDSLMDVLANIGPSLVIPMHFHFAGALPAFTNRAREQDYRIIEAQTSSLTMSRKALPAQKTVYIMMPGGA
jgi:L-ascorbate metabolism protein UlaG (beta-lactamase superfamily)